jgi:hypothetical protein
MKMFLAGYFFVGAAGGFAFDLLQLNASLLPEPGGNGRRCVTDRRDDLSALIHELSRNADCLRGHG